MTHYQPLRAPFENDPPGWVTTGCMFTLRESLPRVKLPLDNDWVNVGDGGVRLRHV